MSLKRLPQAERLLSGTLSAYLSAAATSATVNNPPDVNKLPTYIEIEPDSDNAETVRVTGVAGNVITIERGVYNGGTGQEHQANSTYKQKISQLHWDAVVLALESGYITEDPSQTFTRNSITEFQIESADHTAYYQAGRILRINGNTDVIVQSSVLTGGHTVVTVAGDSLPATITSVELAIQPREATNIYLRLLDKATGEEINNGILQNKYVTPKAIADSKVSITDKVETLSNKTLTSPVFNGNVDGWISANETWSYNSANKINVPSGAASKYAKGDKIKVTANSVVLYAYIIGVADTVLTVAGDALTNHTFTANYYSHAQNPLGFGERSFSPTITWTATTVPTGLSQTCLFSINNAQCTALYEIGYTGSVGTGVTGVTLTLPVPSLGGASASISLAQDATDRTVTAAYISAFSISVVTVLCPSASVNRLYGSVTYRCF